MSDERYYVSSIVARKGDEVTGLFLGATKNDRGCIYCGGRGNSEGPTNERS